MVSVSSGKDSRWIDVEKGWQSQSKSSLAALPERICSACSGFSPVSPGIHDAPNARRLSDTD